MKQQQLLMYQIIFERDAINFKIMFTFREKNVIATNKR